jgi:hypothetical protein
MSKEICRAVGTCVLLMAFACASKPSGSDAGPTDAGVTKDAGPDASIDAGTALTGFGTILVAFCQAIVRCQLTFTDLTSCEAYLDIAGQVDTLNSPGSIQAAINAGLITVNSSQVSACVTGLANLPCSASLGQNFDNVPGCAGILTDTIRDGGFQNGVWIDGGLATVDGEPCVADEQCPSGSVCYVSESATNQCGATCVPAQQQCNTDTDCSASDVCDMANHTCAPAAPPPGASGQPCGQDNLCESGLACLMEGDGGTVCGTLSATAGGPCSVDGLCGGTDLYCNANNVCAATPGNGQPCNGSCSSGLICVPSTNLQSGTCLMGATIGQPCSSQFQCGGLYSLYVCNLASGTCINRPVTGPCPNDAFIYSCDWRTTFCDPTQSPPQCEPFLSTGSSCTNDGACGPLGGGTQCSGLGADAGTCAAVQMCTL